jgi:hypothetical protein
MSIKRHRRHLIASFPIAASRRCRHTGVRFEEEGTNVRPPDRFDAVFPAKLGTSRPKSALALITGPERADGISTVHGRLVEIKRHVRISKRHCPVAAAAAAAHWKPIRRRGKAAAATYRASTHAAAERRCICTTLIPRSRNSATNSAALKSVAAEGQARIERKLRVRILTRHQTVPTRRVPFPFTFADLGLFLGLRRRLHRHRGLESFSPVSAVTFRDAIVDDCGPDGD